LAVAEHSREVVNAQELSEQLGISPPRVRAQLLAFVESGLMTAVPRSELRQYYERIDDPFWSAVRTLVHSWRESAG
jgi:DNA-binding transcriptional ArsR family regulator